MAQFDVLLKRSKFKKFSQVKKFNQLRKKNKKKIFLVLNFKKTILLILLFRQFLKTFTSKNFPENVVLILKIASEPFYHLKSLAWKKLLF